jgi:hypothetical protein
MITIKPIACVPALAIAGFCMYFAAKGAPQTAVDGQTKAIVTATTAFLNSLSAVQREKVQFPFVPEKTAKICPAGLRWLRSACLVQQTGGRRCGRWASESIVAISRSKMTVCTDAGHA